MAVFFPSAEYQVTTRISTVTVATHAYPFKTEGKVLVKPGWLAIYGKEAADEVADAKDGDKGQNLVPVQAGERVRTETVETKGLATRPPARYSEADCWHQRSVDRNSRCFSQSGRLQNSTRRAQGDSKINFPLRDGF